MLTRALAFLRILDDQRRISLTHLLLLSAIFICAAGKLSDKVDAIILACAVLNYIVKRIVGYFETKTVKPSTTHVELEKAVAELKADLEIAKNKISSLSMAAGLRPIPPKR